MRTAMLVLLIVGITSIVAAQTVPNGGFETWAGGNATGWTTGSGITDDQETNLSYVHGGSSAAKLTINTPTQANCDYESDFATGITAGQDYTFTMWVLDNDPAGRLRFRIRWFDASDAQVDAIIYGLTYSSDSPSYQQISEVFTAPVGAAKVKVGIRGYDIEATWDGDAVFYLDDVSVASGIVVTDVANIAAARAASGRVRITGTVTVNCGTEQLNGSRNQFYIQDNSGTDGQSGLCIDDPTTQATSKYYPGDRLTNITGTLSLYAGLTQLQLTADPGAATPGAAPTPLLVSLPIADINTIESELIHIEGVSIQGGAAGNYGTDANLTITSGAHTIVMRIEDASELVGTPQTAGFFNVTGIAVEYSSTQEIEPRFLSDITPFSGTAVKSAWQLYE